VVTRVPDRSGTTVAIASLPEVSENVEVIELYAEMGLVDTPLARPPISHSLFG
jgi:hypothetical protein